MPWAAWLLMLAFMLTFASLLRRGRFRQGDTDMALLILGLCLAAAVALRAILAAGGLMLTNLETGLLFVVGGLVYLYRRDRAR